MARYVDNADVVLCFTYDLFHCTRICTIMPFKPYKYESIFLFECDVNSR